MMKLKQFAGRFKINIDYAAPDLKHYIDDMEVIAFLREGWVGHGSNAKYIWTKVVSCLKVYRVYFDNEGCCLVSNRFFSPYKNVIHDRHQLKIYNKKIWDNEFIPIFVVEEL